PFAASTAAGRHTKGGHTTTSALASATNGFSPLISAIVSSGVLFIFQFPAIIGVLINKSFQIRPVNSYLFTKSAAHLRRLISNFTVKLYHSAPQCRAVLFPPGIPEMRRRQ